MPRLIKFILVLSTLLMLAACVATYKVYEQGETLVLTDRSKVPCRILDFDGVDIYFRARNSADAYRYGEFIAVGNVAAVHVVRGGQVLSYAVMDYLNEKFPAEDLPERENGDVAANDQQINSVESEQPAIAPASEQPELHLNLSGFLSDSLADTRAGSGIGLNLTERLKPEKSERPVAYDEIADLIVASGGTGLLLYRADLFRESGASLTTAQQQLVDAIQNSENWDERKKSLRSAHKIAVRAFAKLDRKELRRTFKFRPANEGDAFIQFLIYLHKQGDLHNRIKMDHAVELFGEQAAAAMSDILANFDDWYYIVVIQLER